MDSAYDAPEIAVGIRVLGHVPIIDNNPRNTFLKEELETEVGARKAAGYKLAEDVGCNERSSSERGPRPAKEPRSIRPRQRGTP